MSRNKGRKSTGLTPNAPIMASTDPLQEGSFSFATPTEHVDLPSQGKYYSESHPLHNEESIEIRFMTAKEEDILTSKSLLKKGIAIDRLLQSIVIDKSINVDSLLVGDRNALLVASRITGFGEDYEIKVACPSCAEYSEYTFDLSEIENSIASTPEELGITETDSGTFILHLPLTKTDVELRLLNGKDERRILQMQESKRKRNISETSTTDQLSAIIVSVNGEDDAVTIGQLIQNLPTRDVRYLRGVYDKLVPNIDMTQEFACPACDTITDLEVPFTTSFFWPK
jgi:hypothetical protein